MRISILGIYIFTHDRELDLVKHYFYFKNKTHRT